MATPSLAMIPSGYKASKLYSVLPNNGDGDFTFNRDSSATRVGSNGLIETSAIDFPRLDYTDGSCPSLLLEPASTNLVTYSEDFSQSYWTKSGSSVASGIVSPDGTTNGFELIENSATSSHLLRGSTITISNGSLYTFSVFAKKNTRNWIALSHDGSSGYNAWFDLENGAFGTSLFTTSSFEDYGNGWYRISLSILSDGTTGKMRLYTSTGDNVFSYTGDGTSGIYVWGAQVEELSYPTSYIPTSGSTVTRTAETCTGAGTAATFNSTEGVLYAEMAALSNDGTNRYFGLSDGTNNNVVEIRFSYTANKIRVRVLVGGVSQSDMNYTVSDITSFSKIALKWKLNDFALWVDGVERSTDASGSSFGASVLNELLFARGGGSEFLYGKCKDVRVYNTALTDDQLTILTT